MTEQNDEPMQHNIFENMKPPLVVRRSYNVLMLVINLIFAFVFLGILPLVVGYLVFQPMMNTIGEWLRTYTFGLIACAGGVGGAIYAYAVITLTRDQIKKNIYLIRRNIR